MSERVPACTGRRKLLPRGTGPLLSAHCASMCVCVCVFLVTEGHRAELSSQIITTGRLQLWVWRGRADLASLELLRSSGKLHLLCNQTSNRRRPGGLTLILALH